VAAVLDVAAPPYSAAFAAQMLGLMQKCAVRQASDGRLAQLVREFAAACGALRFQPPLPHKEATLLHELLSNRP
jgi:hypothetical protein